MEGWAARATDVASSAGPLDWSISRSGEIWEDGKRSIKFDLNNLSGSGKIWIERPFTVEPGNKYRVSVAYAFSSRDSGDPPRFQITTGIFRAPPVTGDDLSAAFQDDTASTSFAWLHKSYEFTIKSKKSNNVYVVIGVVGTEEAHRQYFIDSLCVTLTKK